MVPRQKMLQQILLRGSAVIRRPFPTLTAGDSPLVRTLLQLPAVSCVIALLAGGIMAAQILMPHREGGIVARPGRIAKAEGLWLTVQSEQRKEETAAPLESADRRQQLSVELKVQNRGAVTRVIRPDDFQLTDAAGGLWEHPLQNFPVTSLGPREYLHAVLAFDIPAGATGLQLVWNPLGQEVRVSVGTSDVGRGRAMGNTGCFSTVAVRCVGPTGAPQSMNE